MPAARLKWRAAVEERYVATYEEALASIPASPEAAWKYETLLAL
jgi:hypothetical protein